MINIVLPIAGRGSRFADAGYILPKPLIPVHGRPMIEVVVNNVRPNRSHQFIFLALQEHLNTFNMRNVLERCAPGCKIVPVNTVTEGAACTVLLAESLINNDCPLMTANSDQWVDIDINSYIDKMDKGNYDGMIMTMWADHPKWSYVGFDSKGNINRVVEKQVISNEATVGFYNFKKGRDFVWAAKQMIEKNLRVNGEFYVAPVYNELIEAGKTIGYHNVGKEYMGMYGMGIPSDLRIFEGMEISKKAVQ
jgi:dTDP-glucose pyrophosphorylase